MEARNVPHHTSSLLVSISVAGTMPSTSCDGTVNSRPALFPLLPVRELMLPPAPGFVATSSMSYISPNSPRAASLVTLKAWRSQSVSCDISTTLVKSASIRSVKTYLSVPAPIVDEYPHSQSPLAGVGNSDCSRKSDGSRRRLRPLATRRTADKIHAMVAIVAMLLHER